MNFFGDTKKSQVFVTTPTAFETHYYRNHKNTFQIKKDYYYHNKCIHTYLKKLSYFF